MEVSIDGVRVTAVKKKKVKLHSNITSVSLNKGTYSLTGAMLRSQ